MTQTLQLKSVQRMITRDICFRYNRAGLTYVERLKFLNMKTLETRRKIQMLKFLFKMIIEIFKKILPSNHITSYLHHKILAIS